MYCGIMLVLSDTLCVVYIHYSTYQITYTSTLSTYCKVSVSIIDHTPSYIESHYIASHKRHEMTSPHSSSQHSTFYQTIHHSTSTSTHRLDIIECSLAGLLAHRLKHLRGEHHSAQSVPQYRTEYSTYNQCHYLVPVRVIGEGSKLYHFIELWCHLPGCYYDAAHTQEYREEQRVVLKHAFHPRST